MVLMEIGTQDIEAHVGQAGRLLVFTISKQNRKDLRDLTGCDAWVEFSYVGEDVHVCRAARVEASTSQIVYRERGDEYTKKGECLALPIFEHPNWYVGSSAPGRGYYQNAIEMPLKVYVYERPA